MRNHSANISKAALAAKTALGTSLSTVHIARSACKNSANQKWSELSRLVHLLREANLGRILEIGVNAGGTLALWAQLAKLNAQLGGIDINVARDAERRVRAQLRGEQKLYLREADSHSDQTKREILRLLDGAKLDFLFIDGDHSYEGVRHDWEMYSPMVRRGGLVAFHDIVPDYSSRFGIKTDSHSGGVHRLWKEIKGQHPHREYIEDPSQDGYGIGVVIV